MRNFMTGAIIVLFIFLSGCNQGVITNTESNHENLGNYVSITDFAERELTIPENPKKIVALSNGEVDILHALGVNVVGRPNGESPIDEVVDAIEVGTTHGIDMEKITYLEPDIVLGSYPMNLNDIPSIENTGAQMVLTTANSVEDIKQQIYLFAEFLNKQEKATEIIQSIDQKLATLQEKTVRNKPRVLLIYGAPGTNMAALPNSLSGNLLEIAGGENIAKDFSVIESYPQYAQINSERIIEADPQIILLMSHGNPEAVKDSFEKDMAKTAGWKELDAIKNNRFIILPAELFGTNPGTKVIEALDYLEQLLEEVKE